MQRCFNYKFNLFNSHESPWEGTRVCKKKNLKSIDFMRQKIKLKNLNYNFLRLDKEKSIQIFDNAGWHFNNILTPEEISLKLKTFAHTEFAQEKFSSINVIKEKLKKKIDLFERGHRYEIVKLDNSFPDYILKNINSSLSLSLGADNLFNYKDSQNITNLPGRIVYVKINLTI